MSVRQSLPSFAVAFATSSLDHPYSTALPPIQPLISAERSHMPSGSPEPSAHHAPPRANGRKRTIHDAHQDDRDDRSRRPSPPRSVRVKEEQDELPDDPPCRPSHSQQHPHPDDPSPSSANPPSVKKRRVTISGLSHPNDPHSPPSTDPSISPVVVGIPSVRDDPAAFEQVRNMISVKRNQEALIEQRRGSLSGPPPSTSKQSAPTRPPARSPNPPPPARLHPSPGPQHQDVAVPHNALPPPSISFTRRRAGTGNKKKPADIMISPRDATSNARLAPVIQSAPPVPHGPGRFPHTSTMAIPSLPPVANQPLKRILPGNVPPTPTRLTMRGVLAASSSSSNNNNLTVPPTHPVGSSPAPASIPIASTLVPPTPSALQTSHSTPKAAFLAPFETFYDALRDAQELKGWLAAQVQKAERATTALREATERADRDVEERVERRMAGVRDEMSSLRRRVEELEDALAVRGRSVAHEQGLAGPSKRSPLITGHSQRKATSPPNEGPAIAHDEVEGANGSRHASPAPFVRSRRGSTSTTRMDPPPPRAPAHEGVKSPSVKGARRSRRGSNAEREREKEASRPASPMEES